MYASTDSMAESTTPPFLQGILPCLDGRGRGLIPEDGFSDHWFTLCISLTLFVIALSLILTLCLILCKRVDREYDTVSSNFPDIEMVSQ